MEQFTKRFQHRNKRYTAVFLRRPFREGLEVSVKVGTQTLRVAELGLGEKALVLRLKAIIDAATPQKK
jgi:hypothetical protein